MRLWHYDLIPHLPRQQLLGQHRECCALRGKGWGRKHEIVDYVFEYDMGYLYKYHTIIMSEMHRRGYSCEPLWLIPEYRGKELGVIPQEKMTLNQYYPEHNDDYLEKCLNNLYKKGVNLWQHFSNI